MTESRELRPHTAGALPADLVVWAAGIRRRRLANLDGLVVNRGTSSFPADVANHARQHFPLEIAPRVRPESGSRRRDLPPRAQVSRRGGTAREIHNTRLAGAAAGFLSDSVRWCRSAICPSGSLMGG